MGNICGGDVNDESTLPNPPLDNIFSEKSLEFPCYKKVSHCLAAKRMSKILIEFNKFKNDSNLCAHKSMYEYIQQLGSYNNRKLLNDYIHLVNNHQTNEEYENIYNYFVSEMEHTCNVINCNNLLRNQRDRSNDYNTNIRKQLYNTSETQEINTQQIIDKIHCYWLHTFDLGYRLTLNERRKIQNINDNKNNDNIPDNDDDDDGIDRVLLHRQRIVRSKREQLASIDINNSSDNNNNNPQQKTLKKNNININRNRNRNRRNNKWILNSDVQHTKMNKRKNKKQEAIYSFGFPYKYGQSHQHDKWYIRYKYSSFKQEISCNIIHQLSIQQFDDWYAISLDYLASDYCRAIKYLSDIISVQHLLSIMIYCGADELQRALTQTYRKRDDAESDNELICRHSEYAYWGQLLYQTANNFGLKVKNGPYVRFYHGIDREMTFESTIAYFHGPLSTSSEYEVALVFALANKDEKNGLIIELHNLDALHASYFDCAWISEYAYESEKFFIGGDFGLIIKNIIAPITAQNYEIYIECLNIIQQMMRGNMYATNSCKPLGKHIKKCVNKLLQHELSLSDAESYERFRKLPLYIEKSLHYYCLNVFEVSIDWRSLHETNESILKGYRFVKDMLINDNFNQSFLDLNVLTLLFPNSNKIIVCDITLCHDAMEAISSFCQMNNINNHADDDEEKMHDHHNESIKLSKLKEIVIYRPTKTDSVTIDAAINDYSVEFAKYGWKLYKKAFELVIAQIQW